MITRDTKSIAAWLVDGAHCMHGPEPIMQELCDRVAATGIPVSRAEAIIRTLHPDIMGRCFLWLPGVEVSAHELSFEFFADEARRGGPLAELYATRRTVRRRNASRTGNNSGLPARTTDYIAFPLEFTGGAVHAAAWSTEHPMGFSERDIADLSPITAPLARI